MTLNRTATIALLAGMAPLSAIAQDSLLLDEITATARLTPVEISRTGATVEIVTEEDREATGEVRLTDHLERVPGIIVNSNGPIGTITSVLVRGAPNYYTPVLIDGIDVSDPAGTQMSFNFGGLTTAGLGRMEVLKGSQSALYGSRAIAGVIDIQSARASAEGVEHRVELEYGSYATQRGSYSLAAKGDRYELSFGIASIDTDGFSAKDEDAGNFEKDGFHATRINFYGTYELDGGALIGLAAFHENRRGEFDEFTGDTAGTPGDEFNKAESTGVRLFTEFSTGAVDHKLDATYYNMDRISSSNGFATPFDGTRRKLSYLGTGDLGAATTLSLGADTEKENAAGLGSTRLNGLLGELAISPTDSLDLTASARVDDHSTFGRFETGRLALAWRPAEDWVIRGAVGTGFRAPSLYELYSAYGDPTMDPEESVTAELGVERYLDDKGHLRATAFLLEADNLIGFDSTATACGQAFGCYNQVPGTSRRHGLELAGDYAVSERLTLSGSYTYTDSSQSAANWARVARHDLSLQAAIDLTDMLSGALSVQHQADRAPGLDDYTVVNGMLSYSVNDHAEAYIRVENLFDESYQSVASYGTSDRAIFAGIRGTF
ncbi:TonB-dependent receptor plug domain-containing protein [Rhodovulum adriaticum]|uniref:Vitamin B12 transporter n=1 Tax=Rhodovulum adriaticum TaxID=35804 RepID=A0A4R2NV41_RHOAD|nr:TonB-dependent receptor [Rhodovulum adriaticum]MBK1635982.1 hypothetical protein [Rhodovulum adriaticum]TCP25441.1 vitamin B12 transporter [Rhodovulum adriaticum]